MSLQMIEPPNLNGPNVRAFFTTRKFSDNADFVSALMKHCDLSKDSIYLPVQKHTSRIHVLDRDSGPVVADAVITRRKNILIGIVVADCVPILLYDRKNEAIGAVHAGWRGTAQQIMKETVHAMCSHFDSKPRDILVSIGPSIRQCCYEVGEDVQSKILEATGEGGYYSTENSRYRIDLASANKNQACETGISESNIWQSEDCTFCNPRRYYSYRYEKGIRGRQGGVIGMW